MINRSLCLNFFLNIFAGLLLGGCVLGPLGLYESARTAGKNKNEPAFGVGYLGYLVKWNYGVTENFDVGVQWEMFSLGVRAKYAFLNNPTGVSVAAAIGGGRSVGGDHYYGDLIVSHMGQKFEPYAAVRVVYLVTDKLEIKGHPDFFESFVIKSFHYTYGQGFLGGRYWYTNEWAFVFEISKTFPIRGVHFDSGFLANLGLTVRF